MKKVFTITFIVALSVQLFSQVTSNCAAPGNLVTAYQDDVKDLALKRIQDLRAVDTGQIVIPQIYQDSIWRGLAAIYNALSIAGRDSVFDVYCVHNWSTFHTALIRAVYVKVDTSYAWTHPWANMVTVTGNTALDNLLAAYGFTVWSYWGFNNTATLRTTQSINIHALIDSIETFSGVDYAEPSSGAGDGNYITYSMTGNEQFFDFSVGWGDCPSGCTSRCTWKFKVDYNTCAVYDLGRFCGGLDPGPFPVNCNLSQSTGLSVEETEAIKIFPNPVTSQLVISGRGEQQQIVITNVIGETVLKLLAGTGTKVIDITQLPRGMYFINKQKFIKE